MSSETAHDAAAHGEAESHRRTLGWLGWPIRHPWATVAGMVLAVAVSALGLPRLELRMDGHALVPPHDPTILFDREVRERFGIRDSLIVLIETSHPREIYNAATLRIVADLTARLAQIEGIEPEHLVSLATERRDRVYPGTLKFRPFLDPFPDTPRLLEVLLDDVAAIRILDGTLVAGDDSAAAILVGVPNLEDRIGQRGETGQSLDRVELYERLVTEAERFQTPQDRIVVVGAPAAEALLGRHVIEDLALLLPLALTVMALILGWRLRRIWGIVLGLTEVAACLAFTFGLMGWLGTPIYLTTAVLPVVLVTLGLADEIHVFHHFQRRLEESAPAEPAGVTVELTMRAMLSPVALTSLTTSAGFLSFAASTIEPIRWFGLFAAAGILFCFLWTLTVIPAALTLLGGERLRAPARRHRGPGWTSRAVEPFLRAPRRALAGLAALTLLLGWGVPRLDVQDSWIDGFAPESEFRQRTDRVNTKLAGTHTLLVHLKTEGGEGEPPSGDGKRGWLLAPELLREIGDFEDFLRAQPEVGGVLGPASHLSTVAHLWHGRKDGTYRIPDDPLSVARVVRFFDVVRGKHRRREVLHDELGEGLVTVFLKNANYADTRRLAEAIHGYEQRFRSQRVHLRLAGDVAVSQAMIPAVVRSQVSSLLLALGGAFLALSVLRRSLRQAVLCLAPVSVSVCWVFGVMGWLGIPLGVATSMFCAISLGVGVDYAVHFLTSFHRAQHSARGASVRRALEETGPAILTEVLAIGGSFGLLLISQVPANARLGFLVALALGVSCLLTLAGLGAWLSHPRVEA